MPRFKFQEVIGQLEKRKGGYYYFHIDAKMVDQFAKKRSVRLKCVVDDQVTYSCGLNHMGDGHFFIILATKHLKKLGKQLGDQVWLEIYEDPNPLGVEVPEVLMVLLAQDEAAKAIYDRITDGKKRSLIYSINRIKNIDLQVERALAFLEIEANKLKI